MADCVIDLVFQPGTALLQFFGFLVCCEINLFFDAIDRVVERMILLKPFPETLVITLQTSNGFTMFREFLVYGMMEVHGFYCVDSPR